MVVVTGQEPDSLHSDGAMSNSEAKGDFLEPATPTATETGHWLPLPPQEEKDTPDWARPILIQNYAANNLLYNMG